jgi:hypothetical protein
MGRMTGGFIIEEVFGFRSNNSDVLILNQIDITRLELAY